MRSWLSITSGVFVALLLGAHAAPPGVAAPDEELVPPPTGTVYQDALVGDPDLAHHDVVEVHVAAYQARMHIWVRTQLPLINGVFTGITTEINCDDDPDTGVNGCELLTRACVGSRTRANKAPPRGPGLPPAFSIRRSGHALPHQYANRPDPGWLWYGTTSVSRPLVKGDVLYYSFPLELLKRGGLRYSPKVGLRITLDGVIGDEPIWLEYLCEDDGMPIVVDGKDEDWSGGPRRRDATGELHPIARHLDVKDLQVDHGTDALFLRLRLAEPGFEIRPEDADIHVLDFLHLTVEPLGPGGYMKLCEAVLGRWTAESSGSGYRAHLGPGLAEVAVARPAAQTRFRVLAWTEGTRRDVIGAPGGFLSFDVPAEAWSSR